MKGDMATLLIGACILARSIICTAESKQTYEGHQVYNVQITSKHDEQIIAELIDSNELDVWHEDHRVGGNFSIHLPPSVIPNILMLFREKGLRYQLSMPNVQQVIDQELASMDNVRERRATSFNRFTFNSHQKINSFIVNLAKKCSRCTQRNIGVTLEGRIIKAFKISSGPNKPAIFIDGGFHAREWISPATVVNIMHRLARDQTMGYLVKWFDWHFVPVVNPDGYTYSRTTDRMWRKNRSRHASSSCRGTDLNRNFDMHWGHAGSSSMPCRETYRGTRAFSEPESRALKSHIERFKGSIKAYLTFHAFGEYFLYPWGYGCSPLADALDLQDVAGSAVRAIANAKLGLHSRYIVGQSACLLGPGAGGSDDWAKDKGGIKYSYTVELPDKGDYGFLSPTNKIKPVFKETFEAMRAFAKKLKETENL